ncbi:MAG TPA: hypothetical protein VHY09_01515, partial [Candidatus Methylacidiphilales bacterium]|nr:hypothetical protein [Candidatus Methylacidiphilales bacterium]
HWTRADKATASYDSDKKMLIFTTPVMLQALHRSSAAPGPATPGSAAPPKPPGDFAPAAPTQWAPPTPPSTNAAPATNTP